MVEQAKINKYIDELKQIGYRPTLICALVANKHIALFKSNAYKGHELIQGGIEHGEDTKETLEREIIEELGFWFHKSCGFPNIKMTYLFEDRMDMKIKTQLTTSEGHTIKPKGKHYIIFAAEIDNKNDKLPQINPDDFSYEGSTVKLHQCRWLFAKEAKTLVAKTVNPKKREIAMRTIEILEKKGIIK